MATKKHKQKQLVYKKQQQQAHRPAARLQEAQQSLHNGKLAQAASLAEAALRGATDLATKKTAQELLAEIYFRLAAISTIPTERLHQLDKALAQAPDQPRLHYQRALTRWRLGETELAVAELEFVARQEPERPGVAYLVQLGRLATDQPWLADGLSTPEINTLRLLQRLRQGESVEQLLVAVKDAAAALIQPELWTLLLQMLDNPKSAPLARWQEIAQTTAGVAPNPVVNYYLGVAAMRQKATDVAQQAWRQAAQTLTLPWLIENRLLLHRDLASDLAQAGRWQEIVTLYEATTQAVAANAVDAALAEIAGIAYYQLGYAAAQENQWSMALHHWRLAAQLIKGRDIAQNLALAEEAAGNWVEAGEAWREMVRRRPRKQDHPDYLTDAQVATIWQRAAHCYSNAELVEEVITCLKNAVKYAPDNLTLRIELVDGQLRAEHMEAAENELVRILESAPKHVPALIRLAVLYTDRWERNPMPIWQRVLAEDPNNADAQQALAVIYLQMATDEFEFMHQSGMQARLTPKKAIDVLETGLKELPGHPFLLLGLAQQYQEQKKKDKARDYYQQALQAAPRDLKIATIVLHELLHVDGGENVKALMPQMRQIANLQPGFWVEQGEKVLQCKLGVPWAEFFWSEALQLAATLPAGGSTADTLVTIFDTAYHNEEIATARKYEQRLRTEFATSGAIEYIEAQYAYKADPTQIDKVLALLRKAKAKATKAKEPGIAESIEAFEQFITQPRFGGNLRNIFAEMFGDLGQEELDAFRKLF